MAKVKFDMETESADLATLREITNHLESQNMNDTIKLGLLDLPKQQLDRLFVRASIDYGRGYDWEYKPISQIHLLVLKTLLQSGADISSMWRRDCDSENDGDEVYFTEMCDRKNETGLDDMEFLIKENHILSKLVEYDLGMCFALAIRNDNIALVRLLVDNGAIMPSEWVFPLDLHFDCEQCITMERIGQNLDLIFEGKTTVDLKKMTPSFGFTPEVPTTVLQWPIVDYLNLEWVILDDMTAFETEWDFFLGKGHIAPPPEAFTFALSHGLVTYVFGAVYLCLSRGINLEFPDLKKEDKAEFNWAANTKYEYKVAGLLEEMIHRSECFCPHSFLLTLSEVSGSGRKFPSLKNISIAAIRKSWLVPDKTERFPDSMPVLRDIPVKPRLIIHPKVRSMIPPVLCDMSLMEDLRKDVVDIPKYETLTKTVTLADGQTFEMYESSDIMNPLFL